MEILSPFSTILGLPTWSIEKCCFSCIFLLKIWLSILENLAIDKVASCIYRSTQYSSYNYPQWNNSFQIEQDDNSLQNPSAHQERETTLHLEPSVSHYYRLSFCMTSCIGKNTICGKLTSHHIFIQHLQLWYCETALFLKQLSHISWYHPQ